MILSSSGELHYGTGTGCNAISYDSLPCPRQCERMRMRYECVTIHYEVCKFVPSSSGFLYIIPYRWGRGGPHHITNARFRSQTVSFEREQTSDVTI